jgi:hypothetical protein
MEKIKVTEKNTLTRVNRRLVRDGERVQKIRPRWQLNLGEYARIDRRINGHVETHVDLESLARELGVLGEHEAVA